MRLILVRHGQTGSNVGNHLDTAEPGASLTPLGREQAAALPERLVDEAIDALYVSTLVRTQQTAAPLVSATGLRPTVRPGIREVGAGALEMANDQASVITYLTTIFRWARGELDVRMPGGEVGVEVLERFDAVVAEAAQDAGTAVLVSHGAIIRFWTSARARNVSVEHAERNPVSNTGAVVLTGDPDAGWTATHWEDEPLGGEELEGAEGPAGRSVRPGDR